MMGGIGSWRGRIEGRARFGRESLPEHCAFIQYGPTEPAARKKKWGCDLLEIAGVESYEIGEH
jgi:hypothetical protein